MQEKYSSEAAT